VPRSLHCRDCKCEWHGLAYLCRRHGLDDTLLYIKKNHFGVSKIVLKSYVEAVEAGRGFDLEMELQRLHAVGALPDGLMRPAAVAVQETQGVLIDVAQPAAAPEAQSALQMRDEVASLAVPSLNASTTSGASGSSGPPRSARHTSRLRRRMARATVTPLPQALRTTTQAATSCVSLKISPRPL
jgi:hypothetical protein